MTKQCNESRSYSGRGCDRCAKSDEPYMLRGIIWKAVTDNTKENFLCLACVELRLGRSLRENDFTDMPINFGGLGFDCREYCKKSA